MEDGIIYLCQDCLKSLDITGLFRAINEVGRKSCTECGGNKNNLDVVENKTYNNAIKR